MKMLFALLFASSAALADDAAILRCRSITDASARLACYDALGVSVGSTRANTGTMPEKAAAPQTAAATPSAPLQPQDKFGLEQKIANKGEIDAIESHIPGSFEGWTGRSSIRLANGQVWQIADDSARAHYVDNPKVRIRRGALGSFYLEIEGTNVSPKVRRVQ